MSFVDDQDDGAALAGELFEGGLELGQELGEEKGGFDLQGQQDLAVKSGHFEVGIGEIDGGEKFGIKGLDKGAQSGGFAGTNIAGDQSGELFLEGESEPALDFLMAGGKEELLQGEVAAKRGLRKTIELIEKAHHPPPAGVIAGRGAQLGVDQREAG